MVTKLNVEEASEGEGGVDDIDPKMPAMPLTDQRAHAPRNKYQRTIPNSRSAEDHTFQWRKMD